MKSNTKSTSARPVKVGGYSHAKLDAKQALRQTQADRRQEKYDSLTTKEKIDRATHQRGNSSRQLRRLHSAYCLET